MHSRTSILFLIIGILLILLFIADLLTGPVSIAIPDLVAIVKGEMAGEDTHAIMMNFRLPKAITAILAGAALSVSGLQMQTVFRNPLAGPYVLGISSGASFGVAMLILGLGSLFPVQGFNNMGNWAQVIAAWIGSGIVMFIILGVSMRVRDIMTILILGILFGSAISAFVSILQYFTSQSMLKIYVIWSLGNLGSLTRSQLYVLIPSVVTGLVMVFLSAKLLNALLLGEDYARSMGVNIISSRIIIFVSTSLLAGSITAFCGPIGFIGIAVPHVARILFRSANHMILIPATILLGAVLMLLSDMITQMPGQDSQLPINSVTSLLGIPIVIWIIYKNHKISGFA